MKYATERMNSMGKAQRPYFFMFDFELKRPVIHPLDELPEDIIISTPLFENSGPERHKRDDAITLKAEPVSFSEYKKAFKNVIRNIVHGNSYLLNLTFPSRIITDANLEEIFYSSRARYRLLIKNKFVVFSPEIFVRIDEAGTIKSFPMKGTIDASVPEAEKIILEDEKEKAEHNTIVDLIRNDLSMNAENVRLERYRYIDTIETSSYTLLQVSSEIAGALGPGWRARAGSIIGSMLPAGSISGAPKKETLRIIRESEISDRGYYTGIFGIFTGKELDSAVMIRFIEQNDKGYVYRSGGGITYLSRMEMEYKELVKKIYVPLG
ncbi:MAG TPA: aminodeoxychorismate synthase component I [Bacteroidetes bacterium]|nr:aminodeoxychorismate synthase component I [Bacteroidota bacterium]